MPTKEPKDIMVSQMVHGTIQSTIMGMYVGAVTSAPVIPADVDATGAVVLYLGTTDDTFENGRFYRFGDGAWSEAPVGATFDLTPGKVVVSDAEGNLVTSDLDATALANLSGTTGNVQTQIDSVVSDVSSQGTRLTTAEGEIDTLQGTVSSQGTAISTAEGEIDTLQSQMGTANSNISSLQSEVAGKQDAITGGATTILTQNLGASKALISDASGKVAISNVSTTELGFVAGVTSAIQTQLDNLASQISAMGGFAVLSVEELPGTGQPNTIYFVPSDSGADQNVKDEYMWLNNAWEQIGSTQFSLSIVQNASGITINGTALQTATTARAGIMTPTEVQAIDALNTNLGLAEDNIETLQTQMGTANSNISTLQSQMAQKVDNNDLATTSSSGLMSASDKTKLNGIAAGANKYVLPVAGTAIGGVKNGGNVVIDSSGNASVNLSGYATTSALNAKADQTTVTELSNNLSTLDSRVDGIGITKQEIENGVKLTVNGASVDINFPEPGLICQITVNDTTGQGLNIGCTVQATGPATLTATTDSSGVATFNIETPGTYTFQTIGLSTGYQSTSEQIGVNTITGSLSITTDYPAYSLTGGTYTITKSGSTYTLALTGISVGAQWAQAPFNGKLRLSGGSTQAEYTISGAIATGTTTNITVPEAMNLESLTLALICDVPASGTQVAQNVINGIPYTGILSIVLRPISDRIDTITVSNVPLTFQSVWPHDTNGHQRTGWKGPYNSTDTDIPTVIVDSSFTSSTGIEDVDATIYKEDCIYYRLNEGTEYNSGYIYDVTIENFNSVRSNSQILEDLKSSFSLEIDSADVSFDFSFDAGYYGYLTPPSIYGVTFIGTLNCRYNHLTGEVEFISFELESMEEVYSVTSMSTGDFYFKPWIGHMSNSNMGIFSGIKIYGYGTLN